MHSQTSSASGWMCHFVGLDVHGDTIVAYVFDSDAHRSCYETEFATLPPKKLHGYSEHKRPKYDTFRCYYEVSFTEL